MSDQTESVLAGAASSRAPFDGYPHRDLGKIQAHIVAIAIHIEFVVCIAGAAAEIEDASAPAVASR